MAKKKSKSKIPKRKPRPEPQRQYLSGEELKQKLKSGELKIPTKLLHEELEPVQEALARYTYKHCGYLLYGNYEQWESGFLRERDPDSELMFWLRTAAVMQNVSPPGEEAKRKFMGKICAGEPPAEAIAFCEKMDAATPEERERYLIEAIVEFDPTYEHNGGEE